ncbi:MAG TPA: 6-pyruvoyl-tetrahydropterin synthase-related protein [Anaerolineae bacterium]|nr:6-pyruvoyl-tetrahydropterin synthase-related protein [Anaerolineae bacterium]
MMTRVRRFDLNLITILIIAIIAALPFLTRPGLPRHTDLELHVFRAAEYGEVWRDGVLYPRWAPDFYYGYGYPIFNYYAPFSYALANVFDLIPGVDPVISVKLVILAAYALGAYGMYFLARRHFGTTAGVIAATAFVLSPYFLFIDPLMRGDLAEFLALSLLPWVFYAFDRPQHFTIAQPLFLAVFVLSHNLLALIGAALLALYLLWRGIFVDGPKRWGYDLFSLGLATALTAIFWLPFITEQSAIRLDVAGPGHFDYHNHFISLPMLLSPSPVLDMGATTPQYIYNLGLVQWLLLIPTTILAVLRSRSAPGRLALFFVLMTLILIFLITPFSTFLWDLVPPAAFVQFPWRFLGPAAFTLAMSVGLLFSERPEARNNNGPKRARRLVYRGLRSVFFPGVVLAALFISALPTMYPPLWEADFGDTSPRGMIDFELSGVALGTTSTGDFLPKPIGREPGPTQAVLDSYDTGTIDKFDRSTLPAGATVQVEEHSAVLDRFLVKSPVEFKGRLLTFQFPGWRVLIDSTEVPVTPMDQSGFMEFQIPSGEHRVEAQLAATRSQLVGGFISFGALVAVFILAVSHRRPMMPTKNKVHRPAFSVTLFLVSAAFLGVKFASIDRCDTCFRYTSPAGEALSAQHQQQANFAGHIELLGYDLPVTEVASGQLLPLTLYWHATAPVPHNYQVFVHLTNPATTLWGQSDKLNPGNFPSTRWPLDKFVWDDHRLPVLPGTPPGEYRLSVGLYDLGSGQRAPLFDKRGRIVGDNVVLDTIVRVVPPSAPPTLETLNIQQRLDRDYAGLRLLGWSIESASVQRPNFARLTLFWQGMADQASARTVRAELINRAGRSAQGVESTMPGLALGEIRRDQLSFWLPPNFPAGVYAV